MGRFGNIEPSQHDGNNSPQKSFETPINVHTIRDEAQKALTKMVLNGEMSPDLISPVREAAAIVDLLRQRINSDDLTTLAELPKVQTELESQIAHINQRAA